MSRRRAFRVWLSALGFAVAAVALFQLARERPLWRVEVPTWSQILGIDNAKSQVLIAFERTADSDSGAKHPVIARFDLRTGAPLEETELALPSTYDRATFHLSPDCQRLLVNGNKSRTPELSEHAAFDAASGNRLSSYAGYFWFPEPTATFSKTGRWHWHRIAVSANFSNGIVLYDLDIRDTATGKRMLSRRISCRNVMPSCCFAPDESRVAILGKSNRTPNNFLEVVTLPDFRPSVRYQLPDRPWRQAWRWCDDRIYMQYTENRVMQDGSIETQVKVESFRVTLDGLTEPRDEPAMTHNCFDPDQVDFNGRIVQAVTSTPRFPSLAESAYNWLQAHSAGMLTISWPRNAKISLFDRESGRHIRDLNGLLNSRIIAVSDDGRFAALKMAKDQLEVWPVRGRSIWPLKLAASSCLAISFTMVARRLIRLRRPIQTNALQPGRVIGSTFTTNICL